MFNCGIIKKWIIPTLICLLVGSCKEEKFKRNQNNSNNKAPNIIFILADDFGIMDIQSYAHHFTQVDTTRMFYETPNINRLMAQGVSFSEAYVNQLCSPTRAGILTGIYSSKMGFTTAMPFRPTYYNQNLSVPKGYYPHDVLEHKDDIKIEQALINGISNSALPAGTSIDQGKNAVTIAEALKDYNAAFIGKWHIGGFGAKGYQPEDQGFNSLAWFDAGASVYYNWRKVWNDTTKKVFPNIPQKKWEVGNAGNDSGEKYLTDDLTKKALDFIENNAKNKEKPFFLYFSHFAVHSPYQGKPGEIEHFENKSTRGWNNHKDPVYASMIKSMDRSVGQILNKLKEEGIEENTLIVFISDNGGIDSKLTPHHEGTDNSPFLGGKACLTEGGIRVPLIFSWKGHLESGKWVDIPVDYTDLFPTLLEASGNNPQSFIDSLSLDGRSIYPLLFDRENKQHLYTKTTRYWHYPFNVIYNSPFDGLPLTPCSAIREGDYKLIYDWYGRFYLFNIKNDPYEDHNLSESLPKLRDKLFLKLMTWLDQNVDKRYWPSINKNYNPDKESRKIQFKDMFSRYLIEGR
ncbi:sulfatase [Gaetbulibacter aestuarii]|uniref:Sulfatase n=1 Tax=Gaetbulibacter aestuarii TaxID=1502358 RepID=A0ABW7MZ62_9FLAO